MLQASADDEDRAAVPAFVKDGEVLPPGAVNVLDLVDGHEQRPTVPPTHLHGFPQQVVQRQIRLHAQLESRYALHRFPEPCEGAAHPQLRANDVLRHRRWDAVEQNRHEVSGPHGEFIGDERQVDDFLGGIGRLVRHRLPSEFPQQPGLADALDAVDQDDSTLRVLLLGDELQAPVQHFQLVFATSEMQGSRSVSAKRFAHRSILGTRRRL